MSKTIKSIQEEIIEEFQILGDDFESKIIYIMELGQALPEIKEELKIDENLIKGCQSKVWLSAEYLNNNVSFVADSNTEVTKGLISLLIRVLSNQPAQDIVKADLFFIDKIGMSSVIGSQRSNGFASMIKQAKFFAFALNSKNKEEVK